jgi:hypothetical protein
MSGGGQGGGGAGANTNFRLDTLFFFALHFE